MGIRIQEAAFDPGAELNAFSELTDGAGAVVTFTGLVRSTPGDPITTLTLECYPELALNQIAAIVARPTPASASSMKSSSTATARSTRANRSSRS